MTGASSLRLALLAAVAALFASLLAAVPSAAVAAAPDPGEDHYWLPDRCIEEPGDYVPGRPGPCHLTKFGKHRPTVVLWGDSHAWQHLPALVPLARDRNVNLVLFMLGGCPPILVDDPTRMTLYACEKSNQMALKYVRRLKEGGRQVRVLLGAFWHGYYSVYKDVYVDHDADPSQWTKTQLRSARTFTRLTPPLIARLGDVGVRVDLVGQAASVPLDPPSCSIGSDPYVCDLRRSAALPREGKWKDWLRRQVRPLPNGSRVVNFNEKYCTKTKCHGFTDGIYTFFDPTHLSASRTRTFRTFFAPTFRWAG
jgi:hypothetical protein